jgi:polyvinyl alcohol dehydrogenase (cytochrome)
MHLSRRLRARGALLAAACLVLGGLTQASAAPLSTTTQWPLAGQNIFGTRSNPFETKINTHDVGRLAPKWAFTASGDISATPAIVDGAAYVTDWGGGFSKIDIRTGKPIWQRQIAEYNGLADSFSRTSPTVDGDTVYIGDQNARNFGVVPHLFAIDTRTGKLKWSTVVDQHPLAILTQSPVVYHGVIYIGVASKEEVAATLPNYPCCTFRGSVVALDQRTGAVLWKTFLIPDNGGKPGGYSGNGVWGTTPAIDPIHHNVLVATGNNYTVPQSVTDCQNAGKTAAQCLAPDDYQDAVVALDLSTGKVKWSAGEKTFDQWTAGCSPGFPPNNCPPNPGEDYDFGDGAHLSFIPGPNGVPHEVVGAGQKSGVYWQLDAGTGQVVWSSAFGPGGVHGGIEWGSAVADGRIYFADANTNHVPYTLPNGTSTDRGFFGALDATTGKILWETVDPSHDEDPGALATANGVVFGGSISGHMYALDGRTGQILWDYKGLGSSNAGPSIVDGTVYWGNGYNNRFYPNGLSGKTLYAFSLDGR